MSLKNTSVRVNPETEEAVIEKAWRDYRVRSWQGAVDLALKLFLEAPAPNEAETSSLERKPLDVDQPDASTLRIPPGKRAILVPDVLDERYIKLLESSGEAFADVIRADRALDKLSMELKKTKLKKIG